MPHDDTPEIIFEHIKKIADEMEECKKIGAADFIVKPASFLLIKYEIRKALKSIAGSMISENSKA